MRVLCVGNRYPPWSMGGYEIVWAAAVDSLRGTGHDVRVLTTVPDPSDRDGPAPPGVHRELRWYWRNHEFPPGGLGAAVRLERTNAAVLARHLRAFAPEVVAWWAMGGMSLSLIEQVRRAGLPSLGVVGDEWMVYGPGVDGWTGRWRGRPRHAVRLAEWLTRVPAEVDFDRAAIWLFNSRYLLGTARGEGWRLPRADVLAPGVDDVRFGFREAGPWRWRLLYCGRLDRRKGITTAIEALVHLPANATLTITGDGDEAFRSELAAVSRRLAVSDRVRFGHSEHRHMPDVYASTDAVLFPVSWTEPWGLVPLEAMAVGRPLVASRAGGGPAEYLEEEGNCLQFEPDDAVGLAAAVTRLATDEQLRERLIGGGRATASRFTERRFHESLERELRLVLSDRG